MNLLFQLRWLMLAVALFGGAIYAVPLLWPVAWPPLFSLGLGLPMEPVLGATIVLQALGTFATGRSFKARQARGGLWLVIGYLAALVFVVTIVSAGIGVTQGPGGLGIGLLVMLPSIYLGFALQVIVLIGFALTGRKAA